MVDRPGDFGPAFERVIANLERTPDLVVLGKTEAGENPYETANGVILDQAMMLASAPGYVLAVIVWEGRSRGDGDLTQQFAVEARAGSRWSRLSLCESVSPGRPGKRLPDGVPPWHPDAGVPPPRPAAP